MTTQADRVTGVLLGQAAGDALGAGYEFQPLVRAEDADMVGGGFGWEPGEWTDDTQQAIMVARAGSDTLLVGKALIDWYEDEPKDVGTTTSASLYAGLRARQDGAGNVAQIDALLRQSHIVNGSSNGALMRTGPVALSFVGQPWAAAARASQISALTHAHPESKEATVLWTVLIERAVREGGPLTEEWLNDAIDNYLPEASRQFWHLVVVSAVQTSPEGYRLMNLNNGKAAVALEQALSAIWHAPAGDTEQALRLAVSMGGDTDTVAAIAGALLGALNGGSSIPAEWRKQLHGWPGMDAQGLSSLALAATGDTGKEEK